MIGFIRLFLALVVTHAHLTGNFFAHWAVMGFYLISGYFSAKSLSRKDASAFKFIFSKFYRLLPIFWSCSILTIILFGFTDAEFTHAGMGLPASQEQWILQLLLWSRENPALIPQAWCFTVMIFWWVFMAIGVGKSDRLCLLWFIVSACVTIRFGMWPYTEWYTTIAFGSLPFALGSTIFHAGIKLPKDSDTTKFFGALSYPVFLLHFQVGAFISWATGIPFGWEVSGSWKIVIPAMLLTIILSYLVLEFEKAIQKRLQKSNIQ